MWERRNRTVPFRFSGPHYVTTCVFVLSAVMMCCLLHIHTLALRVGATLSHCAIQNRGALCGHSLCVLTQVVLNLVITHT